MAEGDETHRTNPAEIESLIEQAESDPHDYVAFNARFGIHCGATAQGGFVMRLKTPVRLSCVAAACLLAAIAQAEKQSPPAPPQPIPFSHKLHAGAQGLKCATCHRNLDPGERMGLATAAMCMQCHEDVKIDSPAIQALAAYAKEKREIKWRRVYEIPIFVFFSHRAHLAAGSVCADCHGPVKEMEHMYRAVETSMSSCMRCHEAKGASTECTFCHEKMN
jgi:hypothetical protein